MIAAELRASAAELVRKFRDGEVTNDDFENEWPDPTKTEDRALRAIETFLWNFYSDQRPHQLVAQYALPPEARATFDRCIAFLRSSHEYEWPEDNFIRVRSVPRCANFLSFGVLGRWHGARDQAWFDALRKSGDFTVWPFIRRSDLIAAVQQSAVP